MSEAHAGPAMPSRVPALPAVWAAVAFTLLVALAVMLGWAFGLLSVVQLRPQFPPMQFNTALLFACSALALGLLERQWWRLSMTLAGAVATLAGLTLAQYLIGTDLGVDQLFHPGQMLAQVSHPGRMAPLSALGFLVVAVALLLLSRRESIASIRCASVLAAVLTAIAGSALLGYALDARPMIGWAAATSMALHTAVLLGVLAVGQLLTARRSLQRLDPSLVPHWAAEVALPFLLLSALLLWRFLVQREEMRLIDAQQAEAQWMADRVGKDLLDPLAPLQRMALRWNDNIGVAELHWRREARVLLKDIPGLIAMLWLDEDLRLKRIEQDEGGAEVNEATLPPVSLQALRVSQPDTLLAMAPEPFWLNDDMAARLVLLRLQRQGEPDGFLVAVLDLQGQIANSVTGPADQWLHEVSFDAKTLFSEDQQAQTSANSEREVRATLSHHDPRWVLRSWPNAEAEARSIIPELVLGSMLSIAALLHLAMQFWSSSWRRAAALSETHKQLEEAHSRARVLLDNTADAVLSVDAGGAIRSGNRAVTRILGWPPDELIGRPLTELFVDAPAVDDAEKYRSWLHSLSKAGGLLEGRHRDGATRWLECVVAEITVDITIQTVVSLRDVNERQHARDLAAQASERFRLAADAAGIGIWERNFDNDALIWDRWMFRLYGCPQQQREDPQPIFDHCLLPDDAERVYQQLQQARDGAASYEIEYRIVKADGELAELREFAKLVRSADGQPQRLIGVNLDITERKRLDRLQREFVSTVSHELRTPLTSISGALGLIGSGVLGNLSAQATQLVEVAHHNSQRLTQLINDLLDMEKMAAGGLSLRMESLPLAPLIERELQSNQNYAEPLGVQLKLLPGPAELRVLADAVRLQQVLANFLSNAAKFSEPGDTVEVGWEKLGDCVRVQVTDRGPGIPFEFHPRIFQKFSQADSSDTRRSGGTGLGLAISRELIERMGGTIGFLSTPGQGSTFWFELPLDESPPTTAQAQSI